MGSREQVAHEIAEEFCGGSEAVEEVIFAKLVMMDEQPDTLRERLEGWVERHSCDPNISVQLWNELKTLASAPAPAPPVEARADESYLDGAGTYLVAEKAVRDGFRIWAEKPHNKKWFKRIDGTPIPNDLTVNITQQVTELLQAAEQAGMGRARFNDEEIRTLIGDPGKEYIAWLTDQLNKLLKVKLATSTATGKEQS